MKRPYTGGPEHALRTGGSDTDDMPVLPSVSRQQSTIPGSSATESGAADGTAKDKPSEPSCRTGDKSPLLFYSP